MSVKAILVAIVFVMALDPPNLIIWLNLFAFGGLEAAFIWPVIMGLYLDRGNKYGALSSMIVGVGIYVITDRFEILAMGMHPVVVTVVLSFIVYVLVSLGTRKSLKTA